MGENLPYIFEELQRRIGRDYLSKRLSIQVDHSAKYFGEGLGIFHWENFNGLPQILRFLLKISGILHKWEHHALEYEVVEVNVQLDCLPEPFEDFRILQLSDIHIDGIADQGERLIHIIENLTYDLCVLTGDFRFHTFGSYEPSLAGMKNLAASIKCRHGILGILGNHDFVEMVPALESYGIRMLLNESVTIERGGAVIHFLGLDDAHFYGVDELSKAIAGINDDEIKLLLVHSPEIIPEAAHAGIHYYICGHTHGGQICLPGNIPILTNTNCNRAFLSGTWKYQNMAGYTSRGTGSSGLAVRFRCPPEITLHRLYSRPTSP